MIASSITHVSRPLVVDGAQPGGGNEFKQRVGVRARTTSAKSIAGSGYSGLQLSGAQVPTARVPSMANATRISAARAVPPAVPPRSLLRPPPIPFHSPLRPPPLPPRNPLRTIQPTRQQSIESPLPLPKPRPVRNHRPVPPPPTATVGTVTLAIPVATRPLTIRNIDMPVSFPAAMKLSFMHNATAGTVTFAGTPAIGSSLHVAETLLDKALNKSGQSYTQITPVTGGDQLLIDTQGFCIKPHADATAVSALVSSCPAPTPASRNRLQAPGNGHVSQRNGVHVTPDGAFRLHEGELFKLVDKTWVLHAQSNTKLKALHSLGPEHLYASDDGCAVYEAHSGQSHDFGHPVNHLMLHENQLLGLCEVDGELQLRRPTESGVSGGGVPLKSYRTDNEPDKASKPAAVAMLMGHILVVDVAGRLSMGQLNENVDLTTGAAAPVEMKLHSNTMHLDREKLNKAFGNGHLVTGLFTEYDGSLHAKVKDEQGNEHSARFHQTALNKWSLEPGWNITHAMVIDNKRGLPNRPPDVQLHLAAGSVAIKDGVLMVQDPRNDAWTETSVKGLRDLQKGQDGFAYCVDKDGAVKRLAVGLKAVSYQSEKGPNLSLGQATEANAGAALFGSREVQASKVAVLSDQRYVTYGTSDGIEALRVHDPRGVRKQLPPPVIGHTITSMTITNSTLYALSNNSIFEMSSEHWQGRQAGPERGLDQSHWRSVGKDNVPGNISSLLTNAQGKLIAVTVDQTLHALTGETWNVGQGDGPLTTGRYEHHLSDRLAALEMPLTRRGNVKVGLSLAGRSGVETTGRRKGNVTRSLTKNYLTSHIQPQKIFTTPAHKITHELKGRAGLQTFYRLESAAMTKLSLATRKTEPVIDAAGVARLAMMPTPNGVVLNTLRAQSVEGSRARELINALSMVIEEVADDTQRILRGLAKDLGINLEGRAPIAKTTKSVEPNRDLMNMLDTTITYSGCDHTPLTSLINRLKGQNFKLESRDPKVKEDSRDRSDPHALIKSRLAINATVLADLGGLVRSLEEQSRGPGGLANVAAVEWLTHGLNTAYTDNYLENKIKKYTDAGFQSYLELEASYDSLKTLLGYLREDNHALTRNLRKGLDADYASLGSSLRTALQQLSPRDNLKISRTYGGNIFGGASGPAGSTFVGGRLSADAERTYGLTFTRFERGLKVLINREGSLSGTINAGVGQGFADFKIPNGHHRENMTRNGGWIAAGVDAKVKNSHNNAISFFVPEGQLDQFVRDLVDNPLQTTANRIDHQTTGAQLGVDPMELIDRGVEQELRTTKKLNLDLDLNLGAEYRLSSGRLGEKPVANFFRLALTANVIANLASFEREKTEGHGTGGLRTRIYSDNRVRVLEKVNASLSARLFDRIFSARPNTAFVAAGVPFSASITVSADNKTVKTFDVRFKPALPVTLVEMTALASALEQAFPMIEQKDQTKLAAPGSPKQLLDSLAKKAYPPLQDATNDAQYAALVKLAQTLRQQKAAESGASLMNTMDRYIKHANVHRIDNEGMIKGHSLNLTERLRTLFDNEVSPRNSAHIAGLAANDPQLAALLGNLKNSDGVTRAELRLEVNDSVKRQIEEGVESGTLTDEGIRKLLSRPESLRIKSISVFRNVAREDSFTVPLINASFKSSSTVSVERLHGEVTFDYGRNQDIPRRGYKVEGNLARNDEAEAALRAAKGFQAS